uniref:Uncharacterized protein n=1 Tax=Corvus moneduloides TaxID=1196302 RepID=A0A8U7NWB5_CORMO
MDAGSRWGEGGGHIGTPPCPFSVLQQELEVPPDILVGGALAPPRSPPVWGSALDGFPPAWPVADAVTRHCRDPPTVPPPPLLPPTAFAHLRRQAAALDALRPRLNDCCRHHSPLPCARRAWTDVLDGFCTDEFGVKTRQFHCCRRHGAARRRCFTQENPAPTWEPVPTWDTNVAWDLVTEPPFPPGEPTAANLGNICGLRELRPGPPGPGARSGPRVRLRVRLEREYGRSGKVTKWLKGLTRFCREESEVKTGQHRCCQRRGPRTRGRCFADAAPHPEYDRELHNVSLARPGPALLRSLCGPTRLFTRPVPELLGAMTAACCPLPPQERGACAREQVSDPWGTRGPGGPPPCPPQPAALTPFAHSCPRASPRSVPPPGMPGGTLRAAARGRNPSGAAASTTPT